MVLIQQLNDLYVVFESLTQMAIDYYINHD